MSYIGTDYEPKCDVCGQLWADGLFAPWPYEADDWHYRNGLPQQDEFLICVPCSRKATLCSLQGEARRLALANVRRWSVQHAVLSEASTVIKHALRKLGEVA